MEKSEARRKISRKRRGFLLKDKKKFDEIILKYLEMLPEFLQAKRILVYVAKEDEVDTKILIKKYLRKKEILVPRVNKGNKCLELIRIKNLADLKKGCFGILEPKSGKLCKREEVDLFIIPGVAFDKFGNRVGYGGGFFDKLLKRSRVPKIALAYNFQIIDKLKVNHYDVPVDKIVTEEGVIVAGSK